MVNGTMGHTEIGWNEKCHTYFLLAKLVSEKQKAVSLKLAPDFLAPRTVNMRLCNIESINRYNRNSHRICELHSVNDSPTDMCPVHSGMWHMVFI